MTKIVYIEDNYDIRTMFRDALQHGLGSNVNIETDDNWNPIKRDISRQEFADVYIFDNEVNDEQWGADVALELQQQAKRLGKNITVITLLSSSPEKVNRKLGEILRVNEIPVLNKTRDAIPCLFWIAHCLSKGEQIPLDRWLKSEGMKLLPPPSNEADLPGSNITFNMAYRLKHEPEGTLYGHPLEWIESARDDLTSYDPQGELGRLMDEFRNHRKMGKEER